MKNKTKSKKRSIPSIQITLTTFDVNENGELSRCTPGTVKIDGDGGYLKEINLDCSIFKSIYVRNLFVLSFGHFLLWMTFDTLSNLQSIINAEDNFGQVSLAVIHASLAISAFFLSTVIIKKIGCKRTLVYSTIGFIPYILAHFYNSWITLIPTTILCGLASGPLWCARSVYINQISHKYASFQNNPASMMNAWFFGVYTVFKLNTEIWGNLVSYFVLQVPEKETSQESEDALDNCGADFCDDGRLSRIWSPPLLYEDRRYILVTVFAALALIALFFQVFFLYGIENDEELEQEQEESVASLNLLATFHQFANIDQILLIPLALYTGLVDGFYNGDYKRGYVVCAWGYPPIITVSICYGVVSVLIASVGGACFQVLGRAVLFILAAFAHLTMFLAMLFWKPDSEHVTGFFLIASALGIGNGIWASQLIALYGVLFKGKEEAGFSCFYFLNSLGFLLARSYSSYLCTNIKIFIPLAFLVIGLIGYLGVEIRIVKRILFEYNTRQYK